MEINVFEDIAVASKRFLVPDEQLFTRICKDGKRTFDPNKAIVCSEKFAKKFKTWLIKNEPELYPFRSMWNDDEYQDRLAKPFKFDEATRKNYESMERSAVYLKVRIEGKPKPYEVVDNSGNLTGMREAKNIKVSNSYWITI